MRCSCRACGTYMVQEEYGLRSGCKCPACANMCHDCMGSVQETLSPQELREMFTHYVPEVSPQLSTQNELQEEEEAFERVRDWQKFL